MAIGLTEHAGFVAALGAAWCWVFTALAFAAAGRRVGATAVNLVRILLAVAMLVLINRVLFGVWWPEVGRASLVLLAISGVIGLAIGDQLLFTALVDIGPRLSTLLMTSAAPPVAAIIAWPVLDEPLGWRAVLGVSITMAGIVWVVLERPRAGRPHSDDHARGIVFGLVAGVCQALGLILSKLGMGHVPGHDIPAVDPWPATLLRMVAATLAIVVIAAGLRWRANHRRAHGRANGRANGRASGRLSGPRLPAAVIALVLITIGAVFGPVLGVWCSMVAVDRAPAGIAATLMAMSPVFVLPFAIVFERERVSWRAAVGAAIAVCGVGVLAFAERGGGA